MVLTRFFFALSLLLTAALAYPQGGAGMGGGGGGFQGGGGDFSEDAEVFRKQLFLSPGDKTEWNFETTKDNEAVLVKVTSSVFDPAVAIHDESGKKLVENDDIEPGNQMAQLIYKLPKPGKYKAVVTNYKGTAGGQFEFVVNRFRAVDLKMDVAATVAVGEEKAWARFQVDKPGDYNLAVHTKGSSRASILGPNGEQVDDQRQLDYGATFQRYRFTAKEPGGYFVRLSGSEKPVLRVGPVVAREAKPGTTETVTLAEDALHDWTVSAKKNDLLHITATSNPDDLGEFLATDQRLPNGKRLYATVPAPARMGGFLVAVINDGPITLSVRHSGGEPRTYQMKVAAVGKPWPGGTTITSSLDWYETELWTMEAKAGDLIKLQGTSPTFMTSVWLLDPEGGTHAAAWTRKGSDVVLSVPVRIPGRYVVAVSGGGIGDYKLTKEVVEPQRLREGVTNGNAQPGTPQVWRFSAKSGQDLAFRISSKTLRWWVQIIGPDGKEVTTLQANGGDDDDFVRLKAPADGEYTVVVGAYEGTSGSYTLKLIDLDK